jgi:predicted signal transduction protein with EAL and GGDEF domain
MDAIESDELLRNADMALYDAKGDGRGTFRFFKPEMNTRMKVRRELEMDLRKALASEQFELYYQPLVVLETNEVTTGSKRCCGGIARRADWCRRPTSSRSQRKLG